MKQDYNPQNSDTVGQLYDAIDKLQEAWWDASCKEQIEGRLDEAKKILREVIEEIRFKY